MESQRLPGTEYSVPRIGKQYCMPGLSLPQAGVLGGY